MPVGCQCNLNDSSLESESTAASTGYHIRTHAAGLQFKLCIIFQCLTGRCGVQFKLGLATVRKLLAEGVCVWIGCVLKVTTRSLSARGSGCSSWSWRGTLAVGGGAAGAGVAGPGPGA